MGNYHSQSVALLSPFPSWDVPSLTQLPYGPDESFELLNFVDPDTRNVRTQSVISAMDMLQTTEQQWSHS